MKDARQKRRDAYQKYYYGHRDRCFAKLGGKCSACQTTDVTILRVDHIYRTEGGEPVCGRRRSTIQLWRDINSGKLALSEFQLLCANHHALKTAKYKESRTLQVVKPAFAAATETDRRVSVGIFKNAVHKDQVRSRQQRLKFSPV
jgi:5-methylcytosine-specific restriction endonuclease McrA